MTKEEAERLARRDRNRLIGLGVLSVLVGGMYLYSAENARRKADAERASAQTSSADRFLDQVRILPFEHQDVLELIQDTTPSEQEFLNTEPLDRTFEYARIQSPGTLEAMRIAEATAAVLAPILADPAAHRLAALRVRGTVIEAAPRPRSNGLASDWMGSLRTSDDQVVHFLVAGAPEQPDGTRGVEPGDYLRIDGLFHSVHRKALATSSGPNSKQEVIAGALVLGPRAEPSTPPMTEDIARLMPSLPAVRDDTTGAVFEDDVFEYALWELMGHAKLVGDEVDWASVPELDGPTLAQMYENGDEYRGRPYRFPVSINLDTYSLRAGDNPLRLERFTEGWVGNNRWKDPVPTVKWIGPFERRDLVREDYGDDHRYVTATGFFFRNHVFDRSNGQPGKAPIFVLHSLDVFVPEPDPSMTYFTYAVFGLTIVLTIAIFLLLRADRRKSTRLYEDMVRRKRARRERTASTA